VPAGGDVRCDRAAWEAAIGEHLVRLAGDLGTPPAAPAPPLPGGPTTTELRSEPGEGELCGRPYVIADVRVPLEVAAGERDRDAAPFDVYPDRVEAEAERRLQALLRLEADAVLIGAGALRRRRHGRPLADRDLRDDRLAKGLARSPLGVVVSRGDEPPLDAPAFADDQAEVALFTCRPGPARACPARVHVIRMPPADLTPGVVMRRLRADFGIRVLLYEGGPAMLAALGAAEALDEVLVTACCAPALAPPAAGRLRERTPLAGLVEAEPLWELAGDARRLVRFRARRGQG
jgi:riboflavin biosynthesis pyrimidine reductase